ncbi:MAG: hypothetical protein ILA06_02170 [Bacteroidaceae bacterium]|nr:hypothetical protein [Bacteroidaceae bacterium]
MKKYFLMLAVALATGMVFTSCGDDDDEGGGGGSFSGKSTAGQLDDGRGNHELPEGYRISSVGSDFRYYYDERGNLEQIYADGDYFDFSQKGMTLEEDGYTLKLSFNGNGFLSKITGSGIDEYDGIELKLTENFSISYNSNKQISSITGSAKETGKYEGKTYSDTSEGSINFTYSGKVLKKVVWKSSYSGTEGRGSETYTYTFDYNNEYENIYGQWTHYLAYCIPESDIFEALAYCGCLGRASSILPDVIYEEQYDVEDGETYEDSDTYKCTYSFNAYGALRKANNDEYTYKTITPDYDVKATRAAEEDVLKPFVQKKKAPLSRLFFRRHRK